MIENLRENFLYERLPAALISLDERGLIQAVVGGFQDRLEDLRSYGKKMQLFFSVYGLPDPENNVVSVVLTNQQGKVYKRSLDITEDTPAADNVAGLRVWAANQLGLEESSLGVVQYDRDLLRLVDISTLEYLAATIGAILYQSSLVPTSEQQAVNQQLVDTYFPRLKIKGTTQSFDVLGRTLGFDDVRVTPLWTRMSPRMPEDVGNPANDPDFSAQPEFYPRQKISVLYDPLAVRDGPFYQWTGTCSNGTASTSFYTSAINGFNPWISVVVLGSIANGTATHVAPGNYALANGAPNQYAYVEPEDSSFRFESLVEGAAMNGLVVTVGTFGFNGTDRTVSIHERLSSLKYRSSYFDLGLTVNIDRAEEVFGTQPVSRNDDIASGNYTPDGVAGTAVSPYRPWRAGSIAVGTHSHDFYVETVVSQGTYVVRPRVQAAGTNQEIVVDNLIAAGLQVSQSMEEVRPATRFPRRAASGLLIDDSTHWACYPNYGTLFTTTAGGTHYTGSYAGHPLGGYTAEIAFTIPPSIKITYVTWPGRWYDIYQSPDNVNWYYLTSNLADAYTEIFVVAIIGSTGFWDIHDRLSGTNVGKSISLLSNQSYQATATVLPTNGTIWSYYFSRPSQTNLVYSGTYDFGNGTYAFDFPTDMPGGGRAVAIYTIIDSEVIRQDPTRTEKILGKFYCQVRPEDDGEWGLLDEQADEYPWLREVVGGGEQVEVDTYIPEGAPMDVVSYTTAFQNQSGVDVDVFGLESQNHKLRLKFQDRPYDEDYQPGIRAVGYKGTFRNLATFTGTDIAFIKPAPGSLIGTYAAPTDYDTLFNPGYALYHVGVVQNVLIADPVKFYGSHHRTGLVGWYPLNEHPEEDLTVRDAARTIPVDVQMTNVLPADRVWSDERGWNLYLNSSGTVAVTVVRGLVDNFALSCWVKTYGLPVSTKHLQYGPIAIQSSAPQIDFLAYDTAGNINILASKAVTAGDWTFVALSKSNGTYSVGVGDLSTPLTLSTGFVTTYANFNEAEDSTLFLTGEVEMHDLRIWKLPKTVDDLNLVLYHEPTPTQVLYQMGFIETANRQDRWGMRVLDSAWVTPDVMPPWFRTTRTALVRRYNSDGSYAGASRFKEVGLGDGHALPTQWKLGYVFPTVEATGTAVVSGSWGALPGFNLLWAGSNAELLPMQDCNPIRDRIWVRGIEDGAMYEVTLSGDMTTTRAVGTAVYAGTNIFWSNGTGSQQLTNAEVVIAGTGKEVFWSTTAGTLVQGSSGFSGLTIRQYHTTYPRLLAVNVVDADLDDPSVHFRVTPPTFNGTYTTVKQRTMDYMVAQNAQAAINAHRWQPYPTPVTGPANLEGIAASDGTVFESFFNAWRIAPPAAGWPAFNITGSNAGVVYGNPAIPGGQTPLTPVSLKNTVSGNYQILTSGVVINPVPGDLPNPRTGIGVTADNHVLMVVVDGRQPGWSLGLTVDEFGTLFKELGATDAINLDGGGSSTLAINSPPRVANRPSDGTPRYVGSNLAVFAGTVAKTVVVGGTSLLDIMFCIDFSGSMGPTIAALKAALGTFDAALTTAGFDVRYGFTAFGLGAGPTPVLVQDLTDFTTFTTALNAYAPGAGGVECGSWAVSVGATGTFRASSNRMFILFTDENDDNGPDGDVPDAGKIAAAYTDLATLGAYFYYAAQIDHLWTADMFDPYIYENLMLANNGEHYLLSAFVLDATGMLNDISQLAVQNFLSQFLTTPPQWMYLHQRTTDRYPSTLSTWTKQGFTATQQGVDITGNPLVVSQPGNPDSALTVAALGNNGRLDFENRSAFGPGRYRLTIETGNIGPTDEDFVGFNVELNLNENIIETVLLRDQSGFNVRGTDVIEFVTTTPPVNGDWLLTLTWFNALRDTAKGTMRQLAVYSYKLEKLATEVFQISINPNTNATRPDIFRVAYGGTNTPGGWLKAMNSYGTIVAQAHEGTIYPSNDTLTSAIPLADMLTGMTNDKREDIIVVSVDPPSFLSAGTVATDPAPLVMPSFGILIDSKV